MMKDFISDVARTHGVTLIVGTLYEDEAGEYNSLVLVTPDGEISEDRYDKRHLVPFGEYVPLKELITFLIPPLAEVSALDSDLTPGKDSALFETEWGLLGSMICFDSIYEMLGIDSVRDGAELMLISSNDSWFWDSTAVYQHQAQAQYRAIEEGRYLLRSANTGISTILTPTGEICTWLDPLIEGYSVEQVYFRTQRTVYSVIGNLLVYFCGAFCLAFPIVDYAKRKRTGEGYDS
jgi:apolipoprotein N-acyltransferase